MTTVICSKCGTENSEGAVNCEKCRINLAEAAEQLEIVNAIKEKQRLLSVPSKREYQPSWTCIYGIGFGIWLIIVLIASFLAIGEFLFFFLLLIIPIGLGFFVGTVFSMFVRDKPFIAHIMFLLATAFAFYWIFTHFL